MEEFNDRVAVVTGGASGIGLELARGLAAEGARIVLADVDPEPLQRAADELTSSRGSVIAVPTDVSDGDQVELLAQRTLEAHGRINVICNIAGVTAYGFNTWDMPAKTWDWVMSVNLGGVIHGIRSFVPHIIEAGDGHVVNMSSMAGMRGRPQLGPYVASKSAVIGVSEVLHYELAAVTNMVGVTVVCPAAVETNFRSSARLWPERLGPSAALGPHGGTIAVTPEPNKLQASDVAAGIIDAMRQGTFFYSPHQSTAQAAAAAWSRVVAGDTNPVFPPPGEHRSGH